ncbi:MAG TPA: hypothetical protein VJ979_02705 [Actinomycetota bacterium]|nr:hypothetical protein [Actinomycetota bacterium]
MRSLWIFTAVIVAALLLFATSLVGVLIGVAFLGLAVVLMFPGRVQTWGPFLGARYGEG